MKKIEDVDIGIGMGNNMMGGGGEDIGSKYLGKGRVVIPWEDFLCLIETQLLGIYYPQR